MLMFERTRLLPSERSTLLNCISRQPLREAVALRKTSELEFCIVTGPVKVKVLEENVLEAVMLVAIIITALLLTMLRAATV